MSSTQEPKSTVQIIAVILLIALPIGIITSYVVIEGFDDEFVKGTVMPSSWAVLLISIGAAYRFLGLGKPS